ncbi:radical SAM protein [Streptomyces caeruleatus]|uniref:Radical SAM protein n=1 Tax=Streptomyces caeruleatus TaxID=661399 RepID=A0A101U6C2_9ACTN|nr:radical SAM protein [Streptomyces caeruleatus]KUO04814.1 radical SAM protein [Streptomyces caeruleatus]
MTVRIFAAATLGKTPLVYDPATELTHTPSRQVTAGRVLLDDEEVAEWPTVTQQQVNTHLPFNVCWSPLVRCNLQCPQCLDDKTLPESGATERERIAGLLADSDVLGHDISGGEPLLLRSLPQLLKALASQRAAVSCTTNGWHLRRRAEELAPVLDAVRVSFDGPDAASHDHWRGKGSFERAVAGVRAAVAQSVPVQLHVVLMQSTAHRAQSVADLAADLGAVGVTFLQMLPIGDGAGLAASELVPDAEARRIVESVRPPHGLRIRLRTRELAEGFTVIRADGQVYHNVRGATDIQATRPLVTVADLHLPLAEGARR